MARFMKTVDMTDPDTYDAVLNGDLVLQCGQWVKLRNDGHPLSRFVGLRKGRSIWILHPEGLGGSRIGVATLRLQIQARSFKGERGERWESLRDAERQRLTRNHEQRKRQRNRG